MSSQRARRWCRSEHGVTLLIVSVGMLSLLAMAVLGMEVVSLYVAKDQAQEAADAAALAGAEALATSGTTSAPSSVPVNTVCNGSSGRADLWAQAVGAQNLVGGISPTVTTSCPSAPDTNPRMLVTVTRSGLPSFFSRIWGGGSNTAGATAAAEAYNPSFDSTKPSNPGPPIQIQGVKPWLIFNCNTCAAPTYFTSTYAIANGGAFIGQPVTLTLIASSTTPNTSPPAGASEFYAIDPPAPLSCPNKNTAVSCSQIGTGPPGIFYHDNIACTGIFQFSNNQFIGPGQPIQVDTRSLGNLQARTSAGTQCLIHASGNGLGQGQDSFTTGLPVTITGGTNNPDASLRGVANIHRSDSVVTAPVFNCPTLGTCDGTAQLQIVGYLQLGIQDVTATGVDAVILNAAGTDPSATGTPVTGASASPVPVRLMH